ncbi:MAG: DUF4358 domain-containing protein [Clostridia bacterium]|nr:DUF4358 domain-containing protein [Clostridia bacterium]
MRKAVFEAARWLAVAAVIIMVISGAGSVKTSASDAKEVFEAVCAAVDTSEMQEGDRVMIKRLYGLDTDDYEGCYLLYPDTNMGAEEILVVKFAEGTDTQKLLDAVEKRIEAQKTSFDGYGIEQYELLTNHSVTELTGNFLLFAVSKNETDALKAFRAAL